MEGGQSDSVFPGKRTPTYSAGRPHKFLLINIQRLITPSGKTKSKFLSDQAELNNDLLVAVTGTCLYCGVFDAEVLHVFPGFSLLRSDRSGRQRGGVALYLRDDLTSEFLSSTRMEFVKCLLSTSTTLSDLPDPIPNIVMLGDFNFAQ